MSYSGTDHNIERQKGIRRRNYILPLILLVIFIFVLSFLSPFVSETAAFASSGSKSRSSRRVTPESLSKDGFAVLEIKLDGYTEEDIHRSEWKAISYSLSFDGVKLIDQKAKIKGRGNYTWEQPKRPYAIKCDEKTDWFGFGAERDWVLLANITDQTQMRNLIALTLAGKFNFDFTPECRPAHVFIDGRYNGLYLITEKNEISKERLNIKKREGDILFELDNNYGSGEPDNFRSYLGNTFVPKDPTKTDSNADSEKKVSFRNALKNATEKINNFEMAISQFKGFKVFSEYMDMDSLVEWYIFNEIMKNDDTLFNSSIYLYNDYDGKLHMGPVWDYDLAMGGIDRNDGKNVDPEGFMFTENYWGRPNWMEYVLKSTTFNNMVSERWKELYYSGTFEYIAAFLELQREYLRPEYKYNFDLWNVDGVFVPSDSFDEAVDNLKNFIVRRVEWLNSQWNGSEVTAEPVVITPTPTASPPRTKAPSSPSASPTEEAHATPGPEDTGDDDEGSSDEWLRYVLLFIGLTAGLITVSLLAYLVILKIQETRKIKK